MPVFIKYPNTHSMFRDRTSAGLALAAAVRNRLYKDPIVLAIPKGGLPIAREIARELNAPLDIFLVRKIGHPANPELAIGAVGLKDALLVPYEGVPSHYIREQIVLIRKYLKDLEAVLKKGQPYANLTGKTVILTDDGMATGNTMMAAVQWIKQEKPAAIIIAVPVAAAAAAEQLHLYATDTVCLLLPHFFAGIKAYYEDFSPVDDAEALRAFYP